MDIGLALPQYDYSIAHEQPLRWESVLEWAVRAEQLGFGSLWLADHLFLSIEKYGAPAGEHFGLDPITALGGLARATHRVGLGTLVVCSQLRPPRVLAKQTATVGVLAPGRLTIGLGAGWFEREYASAGVPFRSPGERLRELAETAADVIAMLGSDPPVPCSPRPAERPRVWIGGRGDRLLEVVAAHGDGWNTVWTWTHEAYSERLDVLRRACERIGRDPASVVLSVGLFALVGETEADLRRRFERLQAVTPPGVVDGVDLAGWRKGHLVGTPDQVRDQLGRWSDLGVASIVVCLGAVPFSVTDPDDLDIMASVAT